MWPHFLGVLGWGGGRGNVPFPPRGPNVGTWVKGEGLLLQAAGFQERPAEAANGVQGVAHPAFRVGDAAVTFLQQLCRQYKGLNACPPQV